MLLAFLTRRAGRLLHRDRLHLQLLRPGQAVKPNAAMVDDATAPPGGGAPGPVA